MNNQTRFRGDIYCANASLTLARPPGLLSNMESARILFLRRICQVSRLWVFGSWCKIDRFLWFQFGSNFKHLPVPSICPRHWTGIATLPFGRHFGCWALEKAAVLGDRSIAKKDLQEQTYFFLQGDPVPNRQGKTGLAKPGTGSGPKTGGGEGLTYKGGLVPWPGSESNSPNPRRGHRAPGERAAGPRKKEQARAG